MQGCPLYRGLAKLRSHYFYRAPNILLTIKYSPLSVLLRMKFKKKKKRKINRAGMSIANFLRYILSKLLTTTDLVM